MILEIHHPPCLCRLLVISVQGAADVEVKGDTVPQLIFITCTHHEDGSVTLVKHAELIEKVAAAHTKSNSKVVISACHY